MENRDRDKLSRKSASSTDAGEVNRNTSQRQHDSKRGSSSVDFGEKIGQSERMDTGTGRSSGSGSMNSGSGRSSSGESWGSSSSSSSGSSSYGSSSGNKSSNGGRH